MKALRFSRIANYTLAIDTFVVWKRYWHVKLVLVSDKLCSNSKGRVRNWWGWSVKVLQEESCIFQSPQEGFHHWFFAQDCHWQDPTPSCCWTFCFSQVSFCKVLKYGVFIHMHNKRCLYALFTLTSHVEDVGGMSDLYLSTVLKGKKITIINKNLNCP